MNTISNQTQLTHKPRQQPGWAWLAVSLLVVGLLTVLLAGCASTPAGSSSTTNTDQGESDLETITTDSGLQYQDLVVGSGAAAKPGDIVSVHYTGWLEDGTKFDSSLDRNTPFEFQLGARQVIAGWDEGVAGMQVGGKRKLIIPAELGYGSRGAGNVIPANATILFEVELLEIK